MILGGNRKQIIIAATGNLTFAFLLLTGSTHAAKYSYDHVNDGAVVARNESGSAKAAVLLAAREKKPEHAAGEASGVPAVVRTERYAAYESSYAGDADVLVVDHGSGAMPQGAYCMKPGGDWTYTPGSGLPGALRRQGLAKPGDADWETNIADICGSNGKATVGNDDSGSFGAIVSLMLYFGISFVFLMCEGSERLETEAETVSEMIVRTMDFNALAAIALGIAKAAEAVGWMTSRRMPAALRNPEPKEGTSA